MDIDISFFLSLKALAVKLDIFSRIKLERKQVFLDKVRRTFYRIYEKHVRDWEKSDNSVEKLFGASRKWEIMHMN